MAIRPYESNNLLGNFYKVHRSCDFILKEQMTDLK